MERRVISMSVEANKDFVRRYFAADLKEFQEIVAKNKLDEWYAPGFMSHTSTGDNNLSGYIQTMSALFNAFPDYKFDVQDLVGENDKVVARYILSGTHNSPYMGIPASGKKIKVDGVLILKFSAGKLAELWAVTDLLGLMRQIGAIPSKAPKK